MSFSGLTSYVPKISNLADVNNARLPSHRTFLSEDDRAAYDHERWTEFAESILP